MASVLPLVSEDYQAENDLGTIMRAEEIRRDPARLNRAKQYAERKRDEMDRMAKEFPKVGTKMFNGAMRGSKMKGK